MVRCKRCGRGGWIFRRNRQGLCRTCDADAREAIAAAQERIREALIFANCLKSPRDRMTHYRRARTSVGILLGYERVGYDDIQPSSAALTSLLETKEAEVQSELGAPEAERSDEEGERAVGAAPPLPPGAQSVDRGGEPKQGAPWEADRDRRRTGRRHAHLSAQVEPGGIRAQVDDISLGGVAVRTPKVQVPGSRVRVTLQTPQGPLATQGIVRWAHRPTAAEMGNIRAGMGLEFLRLPPELKAYLESWGRRRRPDAL